MLSKKPPRHPGVVKDPLAEKRHWLHSYTTPEINAGKRLCKLNEAAAHDLAARLEAECPMNEERPAHADEAAYDNREGGGWAGEGYSPGQGTWEALPYEIPAGSLGKALYCLQALRTTWLHYAERLQRNKTNPPRLARMGAEERSYVMVLQYFRMGGTVRRKACCALSAASAVLAYKLDVSDFKHVEIVESAFSMALSTRAVDENVGEDAREKEFSSFLRSVLQAETVLLQGIGHRCYAYPSIVSIAFLQNRLQGMTAQRQTDLMVNIRTLYTVELDLELLKPANIEEVADTCLKGRMSLEQDTGQDAEERRVVHDGQSWKIVYEKY